MFTLLLWWMLEGWAYSCTYERPESSILFVYIPLSSDPYEKICLSNILSMINVLGADVKTGSVFCLDCDDIITDETFEDLYRATTLHIEEKETQFICMLKDFFKFQKIFNLSINQLLSPA